MKKKLLAFILFSLCFSFLSEEFFSVSAEDSSISAQTLYLKDGSVLRGKLVAVEGDAYVIQTENMGTVKVRSSDLSGMSTGGQPAAGMPGASQTGDVSGGQKISSTQMNQMQNQMMGDPEIMSLIQELVRDPTVQESFADKSLLADIATMDPERIQANPNAQKLMSNPKLQKIIQIMQAKNQGR